MGYQWVSISGLISVKDFRYTYICLWYMHSRDSIFKGKADVLSFICCLWDMRSNSLKILVYVDNMRHLTSKE